MRRTFVPIAVAIAILGFATAARAQDGVLGSIQDYLDRTSTYLDEHPIAGKLQLSPYVAQRFVYDDNIWLNDKEEADTRGRVWDVISDSTIRLALELPVNRSHSKFFQSVFDRDKLTILSYEVRFLEYAHRGGTDSINQSIKTDLFGFLENLLTPGLEGGNRITYDVGAEYTDVSDPIDILVRDLNLAGFPPQFAIEEIRRRAIDAHAAVGYLGNHFDAKLGYNFYWLDFANDFFLQANQVSHKVWLEAGITPPDLGDKRLYGRVEYYGLRYREALLNDANVLTGILGFEGFLLSEKLKVVAEAGWREWNVDDSGLLADDSEYSGGVGLLRLVYQPFSERDLKFQLEGRRTVEWSVISNYRVDHIVQFSVSNRFTKKFSGDVTLAWSHHVPSQGPIRSLWQAGAGVEYQLMKQVTLTARYLFRLQQAYREEFLTTADELGNPISIKTDGDFYQNVVSVGIEITF